MRARTAAQRWRLRRAGGGNRGEKKKKLLCTTHARRARSSQVGEDVARRNHKESFKTDVNLDGDDVEETKSPVEMREVVTEATRKRGVYFKSFTVVVVICILCSQLFVVWKIQDKYRKGGAAAKGKHGSVASGDTAASLYESVKKVCMQRGAPLLSLPNPHAPFSDHQSSETKRR